MSDVTTPRELVLAAFEHRPTERVPKWFGSSPEFVAKARSELGVESDEALRVAFGDDFRRVFAAGPAPERPLSPGATWISPFGVERTGLYYGEPMSHPLASAAGGGDLDSYPWPDPRRVDVSALRAEAGSWGGRYAILGGEWSPFWHDAIDLVGMEDLLVLMYDDPPFVDALLERINRYYLDVSERIFREAGDLIDIYFIGNDFGSQRGPLVGPGLFERFLAPRLAEHAELGHRFGLKVMLHCCGGVRQLVPSMIAAGVDAIHALQPDCAGMDGAALKKDFGSSLVLNGGIDSHAVLIDGEPGEVRERTREILDAMSPGGGYIAGASHDYILPETPVANVVAMFEEIRAYRAEPDPRRRGGPGAEGR